MKKIIFVVIMILFFTGCGSSGLPTESNDSSIRFIDTGEKYKGNFHIIKDKITGVKYIFYVSGSGQTRTTAMCPLLDAEGKPVIEK